MICPTGQLCFGCQNPLGAAVMGLIYVDPEGVSTFQLNIELCKKSHRSYGSHECVPFFHSFLSNWCITTHMFVQAFGAHGEFEPSAKSIRDVFGRMGFDDRNTVSVIGGGHACELTCIRLTIFLVMCFQRYS